MKRTFAIAAMLGICLLAAPGCSRMFESRVTSPAVTHHPCAVGGAQLNVEVWEKSSGCGPSTFHMVLDLDGSNPGSVRLVCKSTRDGKPTMLSGPSWQKDISLAAGSPSEVELGDLYMPGSGEVVEVAVEIPGASGPALPLFAWSAP